MSRVFVILAVIPFVAFANPAPVPKLAPGAMSVEQRVFRAWVEAKVAERDADGFVVEQVGGAIEDRGELDFAPGGIDRWPASGPHHTTHWYDEIRIDAGAAPMRMDLIWHKTSTTGAGVRPAIFKFDGEKLVIHRGEAADLGAAKGNGDYPTRPKDFTPTRTTSVVTYELSRANVPGSPETIRKQFFNCWYEDGAERRDAAGREIKGGIPPAYLFSEWDTTVWDWIGELSPAGGYQIRIDPTASPMRVEWLGSEDAKTKKRSVRPGIFKFDGDKLVMAFPYGRDARPVERADGEYAERPKDFTVRPGVEVMVMRRCAFLEQNGR